MSEQEIEQRVTELPTDDLVDHPEQIFDTSVSKEYVDRIDQEGIIQRIKVVEESHFTEKSPVIISGHRRRKAAREAGMDEVPVEFIGPFETPETETDALHEFNDYREPSFRDKMNLVDYLWERHEDDSPNLGKNKTEAKEIISDRVGMGAENLRKTTKVWESGEEDLIDALDEGEESIHSAFTELNEKDESEDKESAEETDTDSTQPSENTESDPSADSEEDNRTSMSANSSEGRRKNATKDKKRIRVEIIVSASSMHEAREFVQQRIEESESAKDLDAQVGHASIVEGSEENGTATMTE